MLIETSLSRSRVRDVQDLQTSVMAAQAFQAHGAAE
ncbi:UNVERIFIED_ORG: hypothetical protein M2438_005385, partial [Methylobacterium sp. SuP10 SLI 274]|nr:hypothetical protein [Methylobacterium sp. SuP10 SLI 274]